MTAASGRQAFLEDGLKDEMFLSSENVSNSFSYSKACSNKSSNDRVRTQTLFSEEKIIVKRRPYTAVYDNEGTFCKSNCFILKNKSGGKYNLKYIALFLNSSHFKNMINEEFAKAQIGKDYFNDLEIPYQVNSDINREFTRIRKIKSYEKQVEAIDEYLGYLFDDDHAAAG